MSHLWASVVPLLGLALFLRFLLGRVRGDADWLLPLELSRALFLGLLFAVCSAWWLSPIHAGVDPQIRSHPIEDCADFDPDDPNADEETRELCTQNYFENLNGQHFVSSITADFADYCGAMQIYRDDVLEGNDSESFEQDWPSKRSRGAAVIAGELQRWFHTFDALSLGAVLSGVLVGMGIYLWGRILGGPMAGFASVLLAMTMSPMPLLTRMMTFYPSITAAMVMGAALTSGAIVYRKPGWILAASCGIGACLLTDVRGLIWALPFFFSILGAVLVWPTRPDLRWKLGLVSALILPLTAAWFAGPWAYPERADSLEEQADVRDLFEMHGAAGSDFIGENTLPSQYVWGRSNLLEIPKTLRFLLTQTQMNPEEVMGTCSGDEWTEPVECRTDDDCRKYKMLTCDGYTAGMRDPSPGAHEAQVYPWIPIWLICGLVGPLGLVMTRPSDGSWKHRETWLKLAALGVTLLPFLVALKGIFAIREMQVRFLTQVMPSMAVVLGLAFVMILSWPGRRWEKGWLAQRWPELDRRFLWPGLKSMIPILALCMLVFGTVSSWWGPRADWRTSWKPGDDDLHHVVSLAAPDGESQDGLVYESVIKQCFEAVDEDLESGWNGQLLAFPDSSVDSFDLGTGDDDGVRKGGHKRSPSGPNSLGSKKTVR